MYILSKPFYEEKIWGSDRIFRYFNRQPLGDKRIGESFELSGLEQRPTVVDNQKITDIVDVPIVIKYIDARQDLSIQVHPNRDERGLKAKFEVWYILDADPGSKIYCGWNREVTPELIKSSIKNNSLIELMNVYEVKAGDFLVVPPGSVHAIGAGILLCEIQNNSADTLRLYDWGRNRELHIEKALDFIEYRKSYHLIGNIADFYKFKSDYFDVLLLNITDRDRESSLNYGVIVVLEGKVRIDGNVFEKGTTILIEGTEKVVFLRKSKVLLVDNYR